jgi:hypothetical protein
MKSSLTCFLAFLLWFADFGASAIAFSAAFGSLH